MTTPADPGQVHPLNLWLTDRSRYEAGITHCQRARLYRYHHGNHGYGWDVRARSQPTITGTLIHAPITTVLSACQGLAPEVLPDETFVYEQAILPAITLYAQIVEHRGLANVVDPQELGLRVVEQTTLLEGLVWAWYYMALPEYHRQFEVVLVEAELPVVLGCTCGLGDRTGSLTDHDGRECRGIGYMTRGDVVARSRETGTYRYDDFKSTSQVNANWEAAWQYRTQVLTGVLGAEQYLGVTIDEVWIHGLIKGSYRSEWNPETQSATGPKYQQSPLVYGWRQPANPPLTSEQWACRYNLPPDPHTGKGRRLPKSYQRTGIWELPESLWAQPGVLSAAHYWAQYLRNDGLLGEQYRVVGPLLREQWKLDTVITQIVGEENRAQLGTWAIYQALTLCEGDWTHPSVIAAMDTHFPQAGGDACHSFFGSECSYLTLCKRAPGWEDPGAIGYVLRRPHHAPELQQALDRGCVPAAMGEAEEWEE